MQRSLTFVRRVGGVLLAGLGVACVAPYQTPLPSEPHAIVTFRRTYQRTAGEALTEWLQVDGQDVLSRVTWSSDVQGPVVDTLRVRPRSSRFTAKMLFSHSEMAPVTDTFYQQVPQLRTESYGCAMGTCTREVTDYQTQQTTRYVSHFLEVSDATCAKDVRFQPLVDHRYLLEFTYKQHGACSMSCIEQLASAEGRPQNVPCGGDVITPASAQSEGSRPPISP
jgi:hypothetical protein